MTIAKTAQPGVAVLLPLSQSGLRFFRDPRNLEMGKFAGVCRREARHVGF
jgi:hypothetical protein